MPKVSVIIPVYNTEKYLRKCLDSLINQTLSDIEIICINDCSPDGSLNILKEYAEKDKRVRIIDFKENKGVSVARNAGIDEAKGEYIGFVDSDDFIDLDFYEKLYSKASETNADAVKGNIYNCDENGENPILTEFYNINYKIRENKANFLYGFTSAIYKKAFVEKFYIRFPENVNYFEDPYFSISACINYKNFKIVDDAKYYYMQYGQSSRQNHLTIENVEDVFAVDKKIMQLLNNSDISQEKYMIIFDFIYDFVAQNYYNKEINDHTRKKILDIIVELVISSKYDIKIDNNIYKNIKNAIYDDNYYDLLMDAYKKYDYLNEDKKNPFIKILVSYIKPAFLFKSEILTPIHLGRAVEKEDSKDGIQSDENLKWLHKNCEFSDDFEGGISKHNRRIGFLTGTYWAYKNYEKLGNPEYFGSFGYRKLLFSNCLEKIKDYDFIMPEQMSFNQVLKDQMLDCHGEEYYEKMIETIKMVYPEEVSLLEEYMERTSGYYAEMYIMKKDLFFDFCKWIFKIVKYMITAYPIFIESNTKECKQYTSLLGDFIGENKIIETEKTHKDLRDFAFILERLSGYYLYKLTKNSNLKWKEVKVFEPLKKNDYKVMILNKMRKNVKLSLIR